MKKIFTPLLLLICFWGYGQSPVPIRQYYLNPYLFNPSFVGLSGYTEFGLVYRKQWININDAPTISGFSLQYPTKSRVSLGLNFLSQEVVALRNTSALITFGYAVPLASNQSLRFGLSAGVGMNDLNLNDGDFDPNDPVIINASQNNFYMDGNFGVSYTNNGLKLGFALTRIFNNNNFSSTDFNEVKLSELKNRLYSISYKIPLIPERFAIEPYFIYRETPDRQNSWEAASMVYILEKFRAGVSYDDSRGMGFMLGAGIKNFNFGYSFELPAAGSEINSNSHELQVTFRLGQKRGPNKKQKMITEVDDEPMNTSEPATATVSSPIIETLPEEPKQNPESTKSNTVIAPSSKEPIQDDVKVPVEIEKAAKPPMSFTLAKGHYVVVGAFRVLDNAMHFSNELMKKDMVTPTVALNEQKGLYYVYIFSSYDLEETKKARNQYRLRRPFKDSWVFSMD